MAKVEISTPVPDYSGSVGGIVFAAGRAVVDEDAHPAEVAYCRTRGYTVAEVDETPAEEPEEQTASPEPPKRSASTETWRTYAIEHGGMTADEAAQMTRDQLVERFTKEETP